MKKKCYFCEATTDRSRDDYAEIGWGAYQVGKNKAVDGCPKHRAELHKKMKEDMEK
jgi:hypothetical protein